MKAANSMVAGSNLTTLVCDWGDTLMVNFTAQRGPMAAWSEVAAVAGAAAALNELQKKYRLVLATNAAESRSAQVRQALARVGLDGYFSAVFTAAELGSRKPEPAFFRSIQSVLGLESRDLLMLGDDYAIDVLGAKQAGWRAVWFNPRQSAAPGLLPQQDLDLTHWSHLPDLLASPVLPDYAQCISWILSQPASPNLLAHVQAVAAAAYQLALWLRAQGLNVDPILAHRGGLLHDLAKLKAIQRASEQRIGHAELAAMILRDLQQPVLAEIARRHPLFTLRQPEDAPRTWEEKLVYFADKIVEGAHVAGLEERIASLRRRYPADDARIAAMTPALIDLQAEICAAAGIPPADLAPRLKSAFQG
jgi:HAD superfamily hydrolase (TIGR01509 family)